MKKKFKRSVRDRTTAKIRRRRIMSALLAVSVFVSNGLLCSLPKIDFTAVAEDEDISEPIEESTDSGPAEENNIENPDGSEQTDEDGESTDSEDITAVEDEEVNNAEDDIEQPDADIEIVAEGVATLEGNGEGEEQVTTSVTSDTPAPATTTTAVVFDIRVMPEKHPNVLVKSWESKSGNSKDDPYIIRGTQTVTVCGETTNFEIINTCDGSGCNHLKAKHKIENPRDWTHGYMDDPDNPTVCFEFKDNTASNVYLGLSDDPDATGNSNYKKSKLSDTLCTINDYNYEIVYSDGNGNSVLLVSKEIETKNIESNDEGIVTRKLVFNDGTKHYYDGSSDSVKDWQHMYISVRPSTSYIDVYSEVTNKDMNHVHEYVNDANLSDSAKVHVKDTVFTNNNGTTSTGTTIENSESTPYLLLQGDSVFIRGNIPGRDIKNNMTPSFDGLSYWQDAENKWHSTVTATAKVDNETYEKNEQGGFIKLTVSGEVDKTFNVKYDTGLTDVDGTPVYETFYFKIYDDRESNAWTHGFWDHSDIEIADGGTYTIETEDPDGNTYVVKYKIEVSDVNKCEIYGSDSYTENSRPNPEDELSGSLLTIRNQYWNELSEEDKNYYKGIITKIENGTKLTSDEQDVYDKLMKDYQFPREMNYIPASDYWKDPSIGPSDPQFELTSKYVRFDGGKDEQGNYKQGGVDTDSIKDNLSYKMANVGGAKFYLQLLLIPDSIEGYKTGDVNKTPITVSDAKKKEYNEELTISNAEFPMSYQSVLDAFNKCPDNSGLDFTIKSDISDKITITPAQALIQAKKVLEYKELEAGQFNFQLYYIPNDGAEPDPIGKPVTNASLQEGGLITFPKQPFVAEGTYKYQIKEVIGDDDTITYDASIIDVTIVVTKNEDSTLTAQTTYRKNGKVAEPTFTNLYNVQEFYKLPSAGGPGVYIYIISGVGLMLSAAVMYRRKRKEE